MSTLTCRQCGEHIPYRDPEAYDDRCDDCIRKSEQADEVRYIISVLEKGVTAAQQGNLRDLRCSIRDARHLIMDMEKVINN